MSAKLPKPEQVYTKTANEETNELNNAEEIYQNLQGPTPPKRSVSLTMGPWTARETEPPEAHYKWEAPAYYDDDPPLRHQPTPGQPRTAAGSADYHSINDPSRMGMRQRQQQRHCNRKEEDGYTPFRIILQHITTGVHVCTLLYTILVVYLCFSQEITFFTWHPLLLSIGWCFLMTEGVLALSRDNFLSGTLPRPTRILWHWSLQGLALLLLAGGFFVVYSNKNNLNKEHFKTWHGLLGLIATILAYVSASGGIAALYGPELARYVRPNVTKILHVSLGIATYAIGGATLFLSVYTKWFERNTEGSEIVAKFGMGMVAISAVWTLARPLMNLWDRLRHCC